MSFVIKQGTYEGPLDLLLELIEKQELDITTISLASVTDAYLEYVKALERQDLPEISDWLVIAARLILLKSRALLPGEPEEDEEEDDLAAQLAEYQRYKQAAKSLAGRLDSDAISFGKDPSIIELPKDTVFDGVDLKALHESFLEVVEQLPEPRPARTETLDEQLTIDECIDRITGSLAEGPQEFKGLFGGLRSRLAMIVTFLAVLELVKQRLLAISRHGSGLTVSLRA